MCRCQIRRRYKQIPHHLESAIVSDSEYGKIIFSVQQIGRTS